MRKTGPMLALLLAACVNQGGIKPLKPLEIATAPYQGVVTTALTGSLMYEGGCLLFRDEATNALLMPVWPIGSSFNGTSLFFHNPGRADQRVMLTEEFLMSGQPLTWQTLAAGTYIPFHQQCGAQPFFVSEVRPAN